MEWAIEYRLDFEDSDPEYISNLPSLAFAWDASKRLQQRFGGRLIALDIKAYSYHNGSVPYLEEHIQII